MTVTTRSLFVIALSLTLPACAPAADDNSPRYGAPTALRGDYFSGFETSAIALCATPRDRCPSALTFIYPGPEKRCWVDFTKRGYAQLRTLRGDVHDGDEKDGWLEGRGRIARSPRGFGHLAAYPCQVEIDEVTSFDKGSPYINRPPPAED